MIEPQHDPKQSARTGQNVSCETMELLGSYAATLVKWNAKINLVSGSTLPDLWARHIEDSLQIMPLVVQQWRHWVDIGSGGGLPGIVVAIVSKETSPASVVTLIESDQRKAVFLRAVIRDLKLNAEVLSVRAENAPPLNADVVSARAVAPLKDLLPLVLRHLKPTGEGVFPKGRSFDAELAEAKREWSFEYNAHASRIAPDSVVVTVRNLSRV